VTKAFTTVLVVATVAWALYMILAADEIKRHKPEGDGHVGAQGLGVSADARTLPMSEVRRGITLAIQDKFPGRRIVVGLAACQRTDAHGGRCNVRVYTQPKHQRWCGNGWARLIGESDYMRAHGTLKPCRSLRGT